MIYNPYHRAVGVESVQLQVDLLVYSSFGFLVIVLSDLRNSHPSGVHGSVVKRQKEIVRAGKVSTVTAAANFRLKARSR